MINTLTNELDWDLKWCQAGANDNNFESAKTFYNQAFGKLLMFSLLCPNERAEAEVLWMMEYRPKFEKIVYGG